MITLGLRGISLKKNEPSPSGAQTLSEIIKGVELSPELFANLSETVAWCGSTRSESNQLRSLELDPSALLKVPSDGSDIEVWVERKRKSHRLAVEAIITNRYNLVRSEKLALSDSAIGESRGRLLAYEPMETVDDGASNASSHGFFDFEDAPPWDTWFHHSDGSIFSWVPEAKIINAQAGIDANPVDCIHWCDRRLRW